MFSPESLIGNDAIFLQKINRNKEPKCTTVSVSLSTLNVGNSRYLFDRNAVAHSLLVRIISLAVSRLCTVRRANNGESVGLSVCRRLVTKHVGRATEQIYTVSSSFTASPCGAAPASRSSSSSHFHVQGGGDGAVLVPWSYPMYRSVVVSMHLRDVPHSLLAHVIIRRAAAETDSTTGSTVMTPTRAQYTRLSHAASHIAIRPCRGRGLLQ